MAKQQKGSKEHLAKLLAAPDRVKLRELLRNNTGEHDDLDFKRDWIDDDTLAKHILGFANSGGGAIVFGVEEKKDGTLAAVGLSSFKNKTHVMKPLRKYLPKQDIYYIEDFTYEEGSDYGDIAGKKFQVLFVEDDPTHIPFLSLKGGNDIERNRIYCRRDVSTDEATHEEVQEIINRRIETGYSTRSEKELMVHLNELKELIRMLPSGFVASFALIEHPDMKSFYGYISKIVEKKKAIIEKLIENM